MLPSLSALSFVLRGSALGKCCQKQGMRMFIMFVLFAGAALFQFKQ